MGGILEKTGKLPIVNALLYEYLNTTDQSGPFHDRDGIVYGGNDDYYIGQYPAGWSYYGRTMGTTLITSPLYNKDGKTSTTNNRVHAHHIGIEGGISGFNYRFLATFSENYGYNAIYLSPSIMKKYSSIMVDINKKFVKLWNTELGCALAYDNGVLLGNSYGLKLSIRKSGDLFKY